METDPTKFIPAFYAGRSIFITGGSGFMGKVLIEKLLRSCPDIAEIFLLMRPKKGTSIDDRLRKMLTLPATRPWLSLREERATLWRDWLQLITVPLFDKVRETDPTVFKKLIPVTGDVAEEGLGLPTIERRVLIEKVSIIFHVAASVRFDDPLKQAILLNTRGTREVCILAAEMKKLVVLLHVSTTYSNTDRPVIDEMLYPPHANWKKTIKIAETVDEHTLNIMTAKYLGKLPNTYTFTKQLAEHVINEYAGIIPSVIFRPSVVISSLDEPVPGWLDNFNGPVGMMIGGGKGVLRTMYGAPNAITDFIPVDIAIKAMLVTAWRRGITTITKDPSIPVYNCASGGIKVIRTKDLVKMGLRITGEIPMEGILWLPNTTMHSSKFWYYLNFLILHLLPAVIIDSLLKLSGAKPRLLHLQRKVYTANFALRHFLTENWTFKNKKLLEELANLPEISKADFGFEISGFDIPNFFRICTIGAKRYLLKEDMGRLDEAKAHYNKMWWIDRALKVWLGIFVTWAVVTSGLLPWMLNCVTSVFDISLD